MNTACGILCKYWRNSSTKETKQITLAGTLGDNFSTMLTTYVSQWNTFDNSLASPPGVGNTLAIQHAREQEYYLAANVLKASQDKQTGAVMNPGLKARGLQQS